MKETEKGQKQFKSSASLVIYFLKGSTGFFLLSMVFASAVSFLDMVLPRNDQFYSGQCDW